MKRLRACFLLFSLGMVGEISAATWTWTIAQDAQNRAARAEVTTFMYDKEWAYTVEIDDGPKWVRPFAVPFLAQYRWTDAPPGIKGGTSKPFVGGIAVIVAAVGSNDSIVNWDDLKAIAQSGWGILNHSWAHSYIHWDPKTKITEDQAREDAYWSQAVLASGLSTGRAPTAAVYANGTVDYNLNGALSKVGIGIATRTGAPHGSDVTSAKVNLMDFPRSYLDEQVWSAPGKDDPMHDFPGTDQGGPARNSFVIDFTHGIDRKPESPNYQRWQQRLSTIAQTWGAAGKDDVWVAPTDAVANYVRAARVAVVTYAAGKLTVTIPDDLPGTPLTFRITGSQAKNLVAPPGGTLYAKDGVVWLTTPMIGQPGAPAPKLVSVYEGPVGDVTFDRAVPVAGVNVSLAGKFPENTTFHLALHTAAGDVSLPVEPFGNGGWMGGGRLYSLLPMKPAVSSTGASVERIAGMQKMQIWALDDGKPLPVAKSSSAAHP